MWDFGCLCGISAEVEKCIEGLNPIKSLWHIFVLEHKAKIITKLRLQSLLWKITKITSLIPHNTIHQRSTIKSKPTEAKCATSIQIITWKCWTDNSWLLRNGKNYEIVFKVVSGEDWYELCEAVEGQN